MCGSTSPFVYQPFLYVDKHSPCMPSFHIRSKSLNCWATGRVISVSNHRVRMDRIWDCPLSVIASRYCNGHDPNPRTLLWLILAPLRTGFVSYDVSGLVGSSSY